MRGLLTSAFGLSPTKWRPGKLEDGHRWFTNIISHILELKRHDEPGNLNIESAINCFIFVNPQKTLRVGGNGVGSVGNRKHTYLFGRPNRGALRQGNGLQIHNLETGLILPVFKAKLYHY